MPIESLARTIISETLSLLISQPIPPSFQIILHQDDDLEAPCLLIQLVDDTKVMVGIEIPYRLWYPVPERILRAIVGIELTNYFAPALTPLEQQMVEHIDIIRRQSVDPGTLQNRVNQVRYRFEVERRLIDVQLVRKLDGDADVFSWFVKVGYDPRWLIEFFELMMAETPMRIQPAGRIQPRIDSFQKRITHVALLIESGISEAEIFRQRNEALTCAT